MTKKIKSALISVYHKDGLDEIIPYLKKHDILVYSTGGTQQLLTSFGIEVQAVEDLTGYPSILDGRVKTLHPKVFGGILAKRELGHLQQLDEFEIPDIDLVVVDLYPFEDTVASTNDESAIIEKIDVGGISLIRAAAKNFKDVVVIPSRAQYKDLFRIFDAQDGYTTVEERKALALQAFGVSSRYDSSIFNYFNQFTTSLDQLRIAYDDGQQLRYGENPHQSAYFFGEMAKEFTIYGGKELSFNNLVDIDAAVDLMREFENQITTFAILKHTNCCGLAIRATTKDAYLGALAGDPLSAFGGILITNETVDLAAAEEIDKQFYEVLIAPGYTDEAKDLLLKKKARIILERKAIAPKKQKVKSILGGILVQDADLQIEGEEQMEVKTNRMPTKHQIDQLVFANKIAKHLKSNTIVLADNYQLLGMGCGQTSRVDACIQAIDKAKRMGFSLAGSVMASDAFFPFPDCVEIASKEGISAVTQPGGSKNDQLSIDFCNEHNIAMVIIGVRHFKH